jgi:hypothetical protein
VDILLLVVTVLSLAAALVAVMATRKVKRSDQERSDARVAALVAAADALPVHPEAQPAQPAATTEGTWSSVAGEWQWKPEPVAAPARFPVPVPVVSGFPPSLEASADRRSLGGGGSRTFATAPSEIRLKADTTGAKGAKADAGASDEDTSTGEHNLFGTVRREQPASPRFAFAAALALVVALGGAAVVFTTSGHAKAPAAQAAHANPLELVALGHSREANTLTINGVVRNPAAGPKLEGLTAVVSLIDEHGGLISTKDVPLDYRALGPGEEAPFKVTVPDPGSVARYRVSFRAGTDVVPHVDRRTDTKLASAL